MTSEYSYPLEIFPIHRVALDGAASMEKCYTDFPVDQFPTLTLTIVRFPMGIFVP